VSGFGLLIHNLWTRKVRTILTALAVAFGVMTVVSLGIVTESLRDKAAGIIRTARADFTVAQRGVSDPLNSVLDDRQLESLRSYPRVEVAVGTLISIQQFAGNPLLIEIGIRPEDLAPIGVRVLRGQPIAEGTSDQIMLGWRLASDSGKNVGDQIMVGDDRLTVTGIFRVGLPQGDAAAILSLETVQAQERQPGQYTLAFVRTTPGTTAAQREALRRQIEHDHPELATVRNVSEFGRVDRTFRLLSAADTGATVLALTIGAVIVTNTMLLSFFERTREFGILRAVGWTRRRIMLLVVGEALLISILGAAIGVGFSFLATTLIENVSSISGIFEAEYNADVFFRALGIAAGIGFIGALYPGMRAAFLKPLKALRHE
jgi:putative ABC transport system permease protein